MKKFITFLALITVIVALFVSYRKEIYDKYYEFAYFSFCDEKIQYSIGSIDPKFNADRTTVENHVLTAASIWNEYLGKTIFEYANDAPLTINLMFDERQRALNKVYDLEGVVIEQKEDINGQIETYKNKLEQLRNKSKELNEKIGYWNSRGGAPEEIYKQLISEQEELNNQINELNETVQYINDESNTINEKINTLNNYVDEFNNLIDVHPEEGIYNPFNNTIEIYFLDSEKRFIHTTAHELGHALGLEHVNDPKAILNPVTSDNVELTKEDMTAINKFCADQSKIEYIYNNTRRILNEVATEITQPQD